MGKPGGEREYIAREPDTTDRSNNIIVDVETDIVPAGQCATDVTIAMLLSGHLSWCQSLGQLSYLLYCLIMKGVSTLDWLLLGDSGVPCYNDVFFCRTRI